jgi:hypothetical protein
MNVSKDRTDCKYRIRRYELAEHALSQELNSEKVPYTVLSPNGPGGPLIFHGEFRGEDDLKWF